LATVCFIEYGLEFACKVFVKMLLRINML
jgi:hypothetical protein